MLSSVAAACLRSSCSPIAAAASILRRGTRIPVLEARSLAGVQQQQQQRRKRNGSSGSRSIVVAMRSNDPEHTDLDPSPPFRVAVVGGGLAGAAAASTIAADVSARVTLFDAGFRGVGGRASSRPLVRGGGGGGGGGGGDAKEKFANPTTDHGCQFVVDGGGDSRLTALLQRHATRWDAGGEGGARFVSLDFATGEVGAKGGEGGDKGKSEDDFFGLLSNESTVWVGVPTIDSIPKALVDSSNIDVRVGWKVTEVERRRERQQQQQQQEDEDEDEEDARGGGSSSSSSPLPPPPPPPPSLWEVSARKPAPPSSSQPEQVATALFDAVVFGDASVVRAGSSSAVKIGSRGEPPSSPPPPPLEALARSRRAPLFSVAALLPRPLGRDSVPFDVAVIRGNGDTECDVSVIVRESAKPGRGEREEEGSGGEKDSGSGQEVWVAVSSRPAAAELLALSPPSKGPPPPEALERAAERLWEAASTALQRAAAAAASRAGNGPPAAIPPPLALRAQRWGAGVETNADPRSLFCLDERAMLASCGDVFGKGDAASALLSGVAAGEALLRARAAERTRKNSGGGARSSL